MSVKLSQKQLQTTGRNDNSAEEEENVSLLALLIWPSFLIRFYSRFIQVDLNCEMTVLAAGIAVGLVVLGNGGHDSRYTALQMQLR